MIIFTSLGIDLIIFAGGITLYLISSNWATGSTPGGARTSILQMGEAFCIQIGHNDVFLECFYTGGSETVIKRTVFGYHMVFVSGFLTKNVGFVKIGVEMVPNFTSNPQKWAPGYQNSIVWGIKLLNCLRTSLSRTCLLSHRTAPPTFEAKIRRRPRDKEADP